MYDIITMGDIKLDTFVVLDDANVQCELKMPECMLCLEYGAKIAVEVVDSQIAGTAPNVAIGLARMKCTAAILSNMGIDGTRKLAVEKLTKEKVCTKFIKVVHGEQSSFSAVLSYKGDRTILTGHIKHNYSLPKRLPRTKWIHIGEMGEGYEMFFQSISGYLKKHPQTLLSFNPGSIQVEEKKKYLYQVIKKCYILFVNLEEAQQITGEKTREIHRLLKALFELGPKKVVITDGANGAYSFDGEELNFCPTYPGRKIESTGAGDAFATGFLGALMNGVTHDEALRWGSVNATSVIGTVGPTDGLLTVRQIRYRLRQKPNFKVKQI